MHVAKLVIGILCIMSVVTCRSGKSDSSLRDTISVEPEERAPTLGGGIDSLVQTVLGTPSCVNGVTATENSGRSDVSLSKTTTLENVVKEITGEVKGSPRHLFFGSSAAGGIYRSLNTSESTIDIIYTARIVQSIEKLNNVTLLPELKDLSSPQIMERCGDEYVAQINRGGMLSVNLNFEFGTVQNREKWQSLLNLGGALLDFSKDLKKKTEKNTVDGTLTVSVHQIGGSPNETLMNVRSCSMSNASDLDACQKFVDEIVAYASQSFPSQIKAAPTVLNYVTVPLRTLGVRTLPDLDSKVLKIRKDLEVKLKEYTHLKSEADLARAMNLPYDTELEGDVDYNQAVIKDVARACYSYAWKSGAVNWGRCFDEYQKMGSSLRKIEKRRALIQRLVVPAADIKGGLLANTFSDKMNVVFAVDPKALWSFGPTLNVVPVDGVDRNTGRREACSTGCLLPAMNKGTLLLSRGTGYSTSGLSGNLEIYPGEAALFVMNDERGKYSDNKGAITIYWRCTNCMDGSKERPTTRLVVPASLEAGVPFKNRESKSATYSVLAYGLWANSGSQPWTDARGAASDCGKTCPASDSKEQVLVGKKAQQPGQVLGQDGQLTLEPGETINFVINDDRGGYSDNKGEMELVIQCLNCQ